MRHHHELFGIAFVIVALAMGCGARGDERAEAPATPDDGCGEVDEGAVQQRVRFADERVGADGACRSEVQQRVCDDGRWGAWSGSFRHEACTEDGSSATACEGPQPVRERFAQARVTAPAACERELQRASCVQGEWGAWSGTYTEPSCTVLPAAACDGTAHGGEQSRERYTHATVAFGERCEAEHQIRRCEAGTWSAWSGTATEISCVVAPPQPCEGVASGTVETRERFEVAQVPYGATCVPEAQSRRCDNGLWSAWSGSAGHLTCEVADPLPCGDIAHGQQQTRERFAQPSVPFGQRCIAESQSRTCDNGEWGPWSGSAQHDECSVLPPADCGDIAHGQQQTRERFREASVPYGERCVAEVQQRTCDNGTFGPWSGSASFESCVERPPLRCGSAAHDSSEERQRFPGDHVAFGETCVAETQTRTCDNGAWSDWSGSATEVHCTVAEPAPCDGAPHGTQQTRQRFATPEVTQPATCVAEAQYRRCHDGTWQPWSGTATHETCVVCGDRDGDGRGPSCTAGPDCDDFDASCFEGCASFAFDFDQDGWRGPATQPLCRSQPRWLPADSAADCNDEDPAHWSDCDVCVDADGDDHGAGCNLGADCDDLDDETYVGATEQPWNYRDEDCDGRIGRHVQRVASVWRRWPSNGVLDRGHVYARSTDGGVYDLEHLQSRAGVLQIDYHPLANGVLARSVGGVVHIETLPNPAGPAVPRGTLEAKGQLNLSPDGRVLFQHAYQSGGGQLYSYDLSNPDVPVGGRSISTQCGQILAGEGLLVELCETFQSSHALVHAVGERGTVSSSYGAIWDMGEMPDARISEQWLFLRNRAGQVRAVDISNPLAPGPQLILVDKLEPWVWAAARGTLFYLRETREGDATATEIGAELCRVEPPDLTPSCVAFPAAAGFLLAQDDWLVWTLGGSQWSFRISEVFDAGTQPPVAVSQGLGLATIQEVVLHEGYALIADWTGLVVVDLNAPEVPVAVVPVAGERRTIQVLGSRAVLSGADDWVEIDIEDPQNPQLLRHVRMPHWLGRTAALGVVDGERTLFSGYGNTLQAISLDSDTPALRESPFALGMGDVETLRASGGWLYAALSATDPESADALVAVPMNTTTDKAVYLGAMEYASASFVAGESSAVWASWSHLWRASPGDAEPHDLAYLGFDRYPHVARSAGRWFAGPASPYLKQSDSVATRRRALRVVEGATSHPVQLDQHDYWSGFVGEGPWLLGWDEAGFDLLEVRDE